MKKIILLLISTLLLTGCYNYKEINELALISAMSIEKEEDSFIINIQSINIKNTNSTLETSPVTIVTGSGKTISDAISSINQKSSKILFPSNLEYILLSPDVIKEDLKEILDYLSRETSLPLNYLIITTTESKPKEILSTLSKFDMTSSTHLSNLIKFSEQNYGTGYYLTIKDLLKNYLSHGITPIYPNIYLKGNIEELTNVDSLKITDLESYLELKPLVFFTNDKEEVSLTKEQTLGFNFLTNHVSKGVITSKCDGEYYTIETISSNVEMKDNLQKDEIKIDGSIEAEVVYYGCKENFNTTKIKRGIESTIKEYIEDTINLAKDKKTDFIGIGSYIYKNNHKYFNFEENDWNKDGLSKLNFDINIEVKLNKQGNLRSDLNEQL